MTTNNFAQIATQVTTLVNDLGFQSEVAQLQAKALIQELTKQVPAYRWTYIPSRVIRNLTFVTLQLEKLARRNLPLLSTLETPARKVALVWEALASLEEGTTRNAALMNAAVNFELAGYQANAMCLAKQIAKLEDPQEVGEVSVAYLTSLFLQRRFLRLKQLAEGLQQEPPPDQQGSEFLKSVARALTSTAFLDAMRYFHRGDPDALQRADETLDEILEFFTSLHIVQETNLIHSLKSLLPVMQQRSTWSNLSQLQMGNQPRWHRYLKLLARGVGSDLLDGRSISELWVSQLTALRQGLLDLSSSKIVKMPTSAGKTRVAELAIVHTLVNNPQAKCVYVAPYRALVSEVEQTFLGLLRDLGYRVSSTQGVNEDYSVNAFEEELFRDTDVFVTTPEKLDLLLRARPEFLENVQLFVLDEAHIVDDLHRGIKIELLLTRLKRKLSNARFVVLSAVVPQETLEDFARWFNSNPDRDILTANWRPSIQRRAKFEWLGQTGVIRYAQDDHIPILTQPAFVPGLVRTRHYEYQNPKTKRMNRRRFPEADNKGQIAAELAFKFAELGPVLVFCPQPRFVNAVANALQERLEYSALSQENLPSHFSPNEETRSFMLAKEWLGDGDIASFLASGIAVHHGGLPDSLRKAIEQDFRQRKYRIIVATNTLAQGVNLPIRTVIIHSCRRYNQETNSQERIPARDYWNIAGRAGRAGEETEGLTIHITLNDNDDADYNYYSRRRDNVEAVQSALFQRLQQLVNNRLTKEALKSELDPEILGILAEEVETVSYTELIQQFTTEGLAHIQIGRTDPDLQEILEQILTETADDLTIRIPNQGTRKVYSMTGLSSTSCLTISGDIEMQRAQVTTLFQQNDESNLERLVDLFLSTSLKLKEMEPRYAFSGSNVQLLHDWIIGTSIDDLNQTFGKHVQTVDEFSLYLDDFFRYRLPWGISSYVRIARELLEIDETQVSDYIKFFPAMVKFGVPSPAACWAMSLGIPSRKIAIQFATAFETEVLDKSYEAFLEWLNTITPERLQYDFDIQGFLLEDITRSVLTSSINSLLRRHSDASLLPREVEVQGIRYENREQIAVRCNAGDRVEISRDYDNLLDRNALSIFWRGQQIGYMPRDVAEVLAVEIDTGTLVEGEITSVDKSRDVPKIRVQISEQSPQFAM
jgi:superfamily II DNA/RNA helicase